MRKFSVSPDVLADMIKRRSQRQSFPDIAAVYDMPVYRCHRLITEELRRQRIFLPSNHRAATCTHPFFDSIEE